jgi:putative membrane protein
MWGWHQGWTSWEGILMTVVMLVVWGAVIVGVVALARRFSPAPPLTTGSDAFRILAQRFAAGEIDEEEYRARRAVLTNAGSGPTL